MDRKKIHELLDLILEIQERGEGKNGYPYVNIEFSNYGSRILLIAQENGFTANGDYDLFDGIATDKQLDNAKVIEYRTMDVSNKNLSKEEREFYRAMQKYYGLEQAPAMDDRTRQIEDALLNGGDVSELLRTKNVRT